MSENFIHVYSAGGYLAGEMMRLMLEAQGIPVICSQESVGASYGLTVGPMGEVKIYVPESRVAEVKELLRSMEEGQFNGVIYPGLLAEKPVYKENKLPPEERFKF